MPLLLPLSFLAFIALGLPDGILGVSWPSMRSALGVPLDALGLLLAVATSGYILSSFMTGKLLSRMGVGALLAGSTLLTSFSLAGYAVSPTFPALLAAGFAAGLGGGAVDAALNTYAAFRFPPRLLNWLHAAYSLGALLGPLVMAGILSAGGSWRWGYGAVAAVQLVLGTVFLATRATFGDGMGPPLKEGAEAGAGVDAASYRETLRLGRVWLGILAFFLYTGVEFSVGQWTFSLLTLGRGLGTAQAGLWVGLFFGGFFGGRVVAGLLPLGDKVRPLLLVAPLGMVAGAALARWGGSGWQTPAGLFLIGLACAPVYPALVAVTPVRLGNRHAANAMGMQVASATFGIAVVPGLTGVLARTAGLEAIGTAWLLCAGAVFLCLAAMGRSLSPP